MSDDWNEVESLIKQDQELEAEYQQNFEVGCIVECLVTASTGITKGKRYLVIDTKIDDIWILNNHHVAMLYHKHYFKRVHFVP